MGFAGLLKMRGPKAFEDPFPRSLLESFRTTMVSQLSVTGGSRIDVAHREIMPGLPGQKRDISLVPPVPSFRTPSCGLTQFHGGIQLP